ncbi:hypothetical protein DPMN_048575 [Dreissena polymorpha]|uniref:Uncharacterized protein n=1 Tax=Dreissena polymorpha TaxID=45954 RepID=A0A9D4DBF6_DREPO|nr:hypothetical protein DPMN_048575 [Dreissena polymorpha]
MQDLPFLKPTCSWRSKPSTAVVMRSRMMRLKILLVRDSKVMPVVTVPQISFLRQFDDGASLPFAWRFFTVPNLLKNLAKKMLRRCVFCFQHLRAHSLIVTSCDI